MKKALLISLAILCGLLAGCKEEEKYIKREANVFGEKYGTDIFIDKETGVQYIYLRSRYGAGLTVRLDANGKPMVDRSVRK